jgi:hypothetical protein
MAGRSRRVSASAVRRPLIGIDQRPGTLIVANLWRREAEPRFRSIHLSITAVREPISHRNDSRRRLV